MAFINKREWSNEHGRMVSTGREPIPKGDTGTGKKASGKRKRCVIAKCQAFASPSGSGCCSSHEQKFTPVGGKVSDALKYKCKTLECGEMPEGDIEYCRKCAKDIYDQLLTHKVTRGLGNVDGL